MRAAAHTITDRWSSHLTLPLRVAWCHTSRAQYRMLARPGNDPDKVVQEFLSAHNIWAASVSSDGTQKEPVLYVAPMSASHGTPGSEQVWEPFTPAQVARLLEERVRGLESPAPAATASAS